jgi:hypothetical protein
MERDALCELPYRRSTGKLLIAPSACKEIRLSVEGGDTIASRIDSLAKLTLLRGQGKPVASRCLSRHGPAVSVRRNGPRRLMLGSRRRLRRCRGASRLGEVGGPVDR